MSEHSNNRIFRVMVAGRGCLVNVEGEKANPKRLGFFATRFVSASSPQNAAVLARSIVAKELDELVINTADHPYQLEADEIEEIIETDPELPNATGFSWFADADGDD